jgi:hypothetical protein
MNYIAELNDDRLPLYPGEESSRTLARCLMSVDQQRCEYDHPRQATLPYRDAAGWMLELRSVHAITWFRRVEFCWLGLVRLPSSGIEQAIAVAVGVS